MGGGAILWLEKAAVVPRYEARAFPYMNLGRVYEYLGKLQAALEGYGGAVEV